MPKLFWLILILGIIFLVVVLVFIFIRRGGDNCQTNGCPNNQTCAPVSTGGYECVAGNPCSSSNPNGTCSDSNTSCQQQPGGGWACSPIVCSGSTYGTCSEAGTTCCSFGGVYGCYPPCGAQQGCCSSGICTANTSGTGPAWSCAGSGGGCTGLYSGTCTSGICQPQSGGTFACVGPCSTQNPGGYCSTGQVCVGGTCTQPTCGGSNTGTCVPGSVCTFNPSTSLHTCAPACGGYSYGSCPGSTQVCVKDSSTQTYSCGSPTCGPTGPGQCPSFYACLGSTGTYACQPLACTGAQQGICPGTYSDSSTQQCPNGQTFHACIQSGGTFGCQVQTCAQQAGASNPGTICGAVGGTGQYCAASGGTYKPAPYASVSSFYVYTPVSSEGMDYATYYDSPCGEVSIPNDLGNISNVSTTTCYNLGLAHPAAIGVSINGTSCTLRGVGYPSAPGTYSGFITSSNVSNPSYTGGLYPFPIGSCPSPISEGSASACASTCVQTSGCQAWQFNANSNECYLTPLSQETANGYVFSVEYPGNNVVPQASYKQVSGSLAGLTTAATITQVPSMQVCANLCNAYPGCIGFSLSGEQCLLRAPTSTACTYFTEENNELFSGSACIPAQYAKSTPNSSPSACGQIASEEGNWSLYSTTSGGTGTCQSSPAADSYSNGLLIAFN